MPPALIIKEASLVLPDRVVEGDLLIEGGIIARIDRAIARPGAEEIDGSGLHVLPGVIDAHVHFREPGYTHKETIASGSAAAAAGGVTSFLEMPNTSPPTTDQQRIDEKRAVAARTSWVHFGFYIGATVDNLDALKAASGVPGIKIFVGSSTGNMLVDDQEALERIFAETRLPLAVHAEDERLVRANLGRYAGRTDAATHSLVRSPAAAARSVARVCDLALRHHHRTHVLHVSSRLELEALPDDPLVSAEVCYPHLFFDTAAYRRMDAFAKVNPALRSPEDRAAAWEALAAGRFLTIGSDHAPHTPEEKALGYPDAPSGMPSVENGLALMLDACGRGKLQLTDIARMMGSAPAALWSIANKGSLVEGYDSDLVLVDLELERTVRGDRQRSRAGWSPWDGVTLRGWPVRTLVVGETVFADGELVGEPRGRDLFQG